MEERRNEILRELDRKGKVKGNRSEQGIRMLGSDDQE